MSFNAGGYVTDSDVAQLIALQSAWTTLTPTWSSTSTLPALGNGTITGGYIKSGKFFVYRVRVNMGSTTTYGSGTWKFELPSGITMAQSGNTTGFCVGTCMMRDNSAATQIIGGVFQIDSNAVEIRGTSTNVIGASNPFTWAQNDFLTFSMVCEAA